jgi:hypothetical protein
MSAASENTREKMDPKRRSSGRMARGSSSAPAAVRLLFRLLVERRQRDSHPLMA